jgi:NADPH2:quinone reductase
MTTHFLLHEFRTPKPGEFVLVHAAAGGLGNLLVQWARHLGAAVIGTVSSEEKAQAVRNAGATHAIVYTPGFCCRDHAHHSRAWRGSDI